MAKTSPPTAAAPGRTERRVPGFTIRRDRPDSPAAQQLIARHLAVMTGQSPAESVHALDTAALAGPDIRFFTLWDGDTALGMGALKLMSETEGELKSMHTLTEARGRGAGAAMLEHLLTAAVEIGLTRLYLETGSSADFAPARRLYARHGFAECPPFGTYAPDPHSTFMCRALD